MPPIIPGTKWSAKGIVTTLTGAEEFLFRLGANNSRVLASDMGVGGFISKTYAQASTLKSNSTLVKGALYFISDRFVYLRALNTNEFALEGRLQARNADYQAGGNYSGVVAFGAQLGIWYSTLVVNQIGDVVIWNNLHWRNLTGAVGTAPDGDVVNWVLLSIVSTNGYIMNEIDFVEYNFGNDHIQRRIDKRGNEISVSTISGLITTTFSWGNNNFSGNKIYEATWDIPNFRGIASGNLLLQGSTLQAILGGATAQLSSNVFNQFSTFISNTLTGTATFLRNEILTAISVQNKTIDTGIDVRQNTFGWNWTDAISIAANIIKEFDGIFYHRKVSLTFGEIRTGNSIPINSGIPLGGASRAIEAVSASVNFTANTTPFTSVTLMLKIDTATDWQYESAGFLNVGVDTFVKFVPSLTAAIQLVANKRLMITADADSAVGDGTADIYITAKIIEL